MNTTAPPHRTTRARWAAPLLALLLCLLALWPLLRRPGLPNGNDVLYHVFRAAEMDRAWANGLLTPRWAESFYTGYGSPVFHYYAPLAYFVTSLLIRLLGQTPLDALRTLLALDQLSAGLGMFLAARRFSGSAAGGLLAALSYVYCPYLLYTEPYSRGVYPELMAFALLPFMFWLHQRLGDDPGGGRLLLAALAGAALILTHNLMALALTGLLGGWLAWRLLRAAPARRGLRPPLIGLMALALGVGLAAFFWLPVLLEGGEVRLENLTAVAQLDYRRFFVPLEHLLAGSPLADEGALNGLLHRFNLGPMQWALALAGGAALLLRLRRRRAGEMGAAGLYFGLAALICIGLMLPAAQPLWDSLGPLQTLQFPWRLLGPAAFCLALLAACAGRALDDLPRRWRAGLLAALTAALLILALPLLAAPEWIHTRVETSVAAYHAEELAGRQRGTTFSNEYLPRAVIVEPDATPRLLDDYADGYPVNKAHLETLPPGVTVTLLEHGPQHDAWRIQAAQPFTFEALTYAFAGWAASVDGQPAPVTPSAPHGLITLPVPAGDHTVRLWLGSTPARDLGTAVSLLVGGALAALALFWRPVPDTERPNAPDRLPDLLPFVLGGALALLAAAFTLREGVMWLKSPPGTALPAQTQTDYRLGEAVRLLGYDLNGEMFAPGSRLELRLYWYAAAPVTRGYSSFVHLSTGGPPAAQADKLNPADRPIREWTSAGYLIDDYVIVLPDALPPGAYALTVGLYTCETRPPGDCGNGDRLPVSRADDAPLGDAVPLAVVTVR